MEPEVQILTPPQSTEAGQQIGIVCESVSCLAPSAIATLGIRVVPVPFIINGKTFLDGIDITSEEFYRLLEQNEHAPTTSAPSPMAYIEAFRSLGTPNIICVTVSGAVSTTAERCRLAIKQAHDELPNVHVELFDSGTAAMAQGLLALEAARVARDGASIEDVRNHLHQQRAASHLLIVLDTLKYLSQTGRLGGIAALAGGVLSIKPIVHVSNDHFTPVEICRTRRRALDHMLNRVEREARAMQTKTIIVQHAAAPDAAEELRQETARRLAGTHVSVTPFSPVMGTYAGPGLLGFAWIDGR